MYRFHNNVFSVCTQKLYFKDCFNFTISTSFQITKFYLVGTLMSSLLDFILFCCFDNRVRKNNQKKNDK